MSGKSPGWYLGLRYMRKEGLVARAAEKINNPCGANFIFADEVLLDALDWRGVLENWWDSLPLGGHIVLWVPDCRYHEIADGSARLTLQDLDSALDNKAGWILRESDLIDGRAFVVWQKIGGEKRLRLPWRKQPKHLLVSRTGAYGDALMAASVLPYFKERGWSVSFVSKHAGVEALLHDPHIDELILLEDGQVAEDEMPFYWQALSGRFDKFINFTHSVEGELLKQPSRADYHWSADQRRAVCGRGYLAHIHALAEAPPPYRVRFYPSDEEDAFAKAYSRRIGDYALWCLRGSAVHKWWPYTAQAICRLLSKCDLNFVLVGDVDAAPLAEEIINAVEDYYGDASRIHSCVGTHSIREVMTLASYAKAVVGPETGIMNSVSMSPVPKIVLLSHSSPSNLTNDWVNAFALQPSSACYPCHRLHYDHAWCPVDEDTGAAVCAASINVSQVVDAVLRATKKVNDDDKERLLA
ncbi:MAG: hypothetical protein PHX43_08800 [Alphaproteobacteria bacterium]|nr:hypothetical protein [Alphaproteobacteria bacterium]